MYLNNPKLLILKHRHIWIYELARPLKPVGNLVPQEAYVHSTILSIVTTSDLCTVFWN